MSPSPSEHTLAGLVLAAGAGSRFGGPKGLARTTEGEPWVARAAQILRAGGCREVLVAVGAAADEVAALLPPWADAVRVDDWTVGVSASLRAGLEAAERTAADALVVITVDTPAMPVEAVARLADGASPTALVRAEYAGRPGHPVLIGRTHWPAVSASVSGDRGALPYLRAHGALTVECGDLWSGEDVDAR
ncbi:NTP transferase domain-containing protein [Microbacterium sp. 18062]|uniref:nucleotidyltransferase family protein n=1 Tax=Microbacterium sp. 18062 TaxID=2681410 RepID=UPI001359D32C|nr:nucleotidyltransferase family protein [Microbacterium sp. 18062]